MSSKENQVGPLLEHPTLGCLQGVFVEEGSIAQFRGIPYASIAARWSDPVMISSPLSLGTSKFDATRHGKACPQGADAFHTDLALIGDLKLPEPGIQYSEFDCFNVVITRPSKLATTNRVPVAAW